MPTVEGHIISKQANRVLSLARKNKKPAAIAKSLSTSKSNVYSHLRNLRSAGLLESNGARASRKAASPRKRPRKSQKPPRVRRSRTRGPNVTTVGAAMLKEHDKAREAYIKSLRARIEASSRVIETHQEEAKRLDVAHSNAVAELDALEAAEQLPH